jgi:hypothetical protein
MTGIINVPQTTVIERVTFGTIGIVAVICIPFLWGGMTKFLEMNEAARGKKSMWLRLAFLIGVWYTAVLFYLLEYLPSRELRQAQWLASQRDDLL